MTLLGQRNSEFQPIQYVRLFSTLCVNLFVVIVPETDCSSFFSCACDWAYYLPISHEESSPYVYSLGICALPYCSSSIFLPVRQMKVLEPHCSSILHHLVVYLVGDLVFDVFAIVVLKL